MQRLLDNLGFSSPYLFGLLPLLLLALMASGCATTGSDSAGRTRNLMTTAATTAGGAYVGASNSQDKAKGAAIGAAAGFVVGEGAAAVPMPRAERFVDAVLERHNLLYRLVEREPDSAAGSVGTAAAEGSLAVIAVSDSPFDVLRTGYELAEEERLAEQLAPYDERGEGDREETTTALESILESELLPLADRLRTKAEIGAFLEGELEAGDLIARTIARQCAREDRREAPHVRHGLRLTVEEP